jgi:hypothetical protein
MASKLNKVSIVQMLGASTASVEIAPGVHLNIRPLNLEEMVLLVAEHQDVFIKLYTSAVESKGENLDIGPVLLAAPDVCAKIIAMAADEEDLAEAAAHIQHNMSVTVQLIALVEIWKASVPDPKKALSLVSQVMAQLRQLSVSDSAKENKTVVLESSQIASQQG